MGLVTVLLVTFLVSVAVGAQDEYVTSEHCEECGVEEPCPAPTPECTTDTVGGTLANN